MATISYSFNSLRTYMGSLTWPTLIRVSRGFVLALLKRIEIGTVVVTDCDGAVFVCGADQPNDAGPNTELRVLKEMFWLRMLLFADMVRQNSVFMASNADGEGMECAKAESREKSRALRKVLC